MQILSSGYLKIMQSYVGKPSYKIQLSPLDKNDKDKVQVQIGPNQVPLKP